MELELQRSAESPARPQLEEAGVPWVGGCLVVGTRGCREPRAEVVGAVDSGANCTYLERTPFFCPFPPFLPIRAEGERDARG